MIGNHFFVSKFYQFQLGNFMTNLKNDWVERETIKILMERKCEKKSQNNHTFGIVILVFVIVFLYS